MQNKTSVALSSVFASFLLTFIKLAAGMMTGSIGILSEAAHSLLDLGAATLTYFAVKIGDKPPDKRHPYGHGKVESVSALVETGLLFLTSAWIIYEAVKRIIGEPAHIEVAWYSFAVMIISILVDFSRSRALMNTAKKTKSQALEADALHFSSDILSSLVVIVGLILSYIGIDKADAFAALGVSLFVIHAGYSLGRRTLDVLVDAAPEGLTDKVVKIAESVDGVLHVKKARVRNVGAVSFIELCVAINRNLSVNAVKKITDKLDTGIHDLIHEADITIETEPISLSNETMIDQIKLVANQHNLSIHDIAVHTEIHKKFISFDLEVSADTKFIEAHHTAYELEKKLQDEFGGDIEVNIHIEPLYTDTQKGNPISKEENDNLENTIINIGKEVALIHDVHDVKIRQTSSGDLFVSLHCCFKDNEILEDVHEATSVYENLVRLKFPRIKRVLVHAEPESERNM